MSALRSFWTQTTTAFRNCQLFFAVFTIGFTDAAIAYAALPGVVAAQFAHWDNLLGGAGGYPEPQCRIWIALAAANVATLAMMCYLLLRDLQRYAALQLPLLFMKSASAMLFVCWFLAVPDARSLLVAALGDFATAWGIWYFPRRALAELAATPTGGVTLLPARRPI
ncbi:MAG TPA: hypothetical protein VIA18_06585 [Polyangia bacterium]|nr:hypothetical protein [Polyangia bacterium]